MTTIQKLNPEASNQVLNLMSMDDRGFANFLNSYVNPGTGKGWSKMALTRVCIYWECKIVNDHKSVCEDLQREVEHFLYGDRTIPMGARVF